MSVKTIRPNYYQHPSGVECITVAQHHNFNVGTILKYSWRLGRKEGADSIEDLRKIQTYAQFEIDRITAEREAAQAGEVKE